MKWLRVGMADEEPPDWDPPEVNIVESEWNPKALKLLKEGMDYAQYKAKRVFRFLHLFSGPRDVLKKALEEEAKKEGVVATSCLVDMTLLQTVHTWT